MKLLTLCAAGMMLAVQSEAQQAASAPTAPVAPAAQSYLSTNVKTYSTTYGQNTQDEQDDSGKSKTFSKTFSVDRSDKVNIASRYGSVTVKTWDKNEVKIDAIITAYSNSENETQKLLNEANVDASKSGDIISFETSLQYDKGNWVRGARNGKNWRREVKINVTVYMPSKNALKVHHQYGDVSVGSFSGATAFELQYGNLTTGDLSSTNNFINVQYGKATLENVNQAEIKVQYGNGLTIGNINNLELDIQYASANITSIKNNGQMKVQYGGGVKIGSAGSLSLTTQYAGLTVGKLNGTITCNAQYGGGVNIGQVESGAKTVNIHAQYAPISLGFADNYNADFSVKTSYGSLRYPSGMEVRNTGDADDRTSKSYAGKIGRGGSNNINISSSYNGVTFK